MSLFGTILEKLGLKKPEKETPPAAPVKPSGAPVPAPVKPTGGIPQAPVPWGGAPTTPMVKPAPQTAPQPAVPAAPATPVPAAVPEPEPIPMVDVMSKLEKLAAENPQKLDWRVSIVDLLKLLDIDSSFAARKELAVELGCPPEKMGDSALMNTWLHKTVLQKLAENGGNIPKELLD